MTSRQVRSLDQRIADTRRELEALEAKKRVRDDKTLKELLSMKRRLEKFADASTESAFRDPLLVAADLLGRALAIATHGVEATP